MITMNMKTATLALLLLFLYSSTSVVGSDFLRDTSGKPVVTTAEYDLLFPKNPDAALSLSIRGTSCPPSVSAGGARPRLNINLVNPSTLKNVNVSDNINIEFTMAAPKFSSCGLNTSRVWMMNNDTVTKKTFLTIGGKKLALDDAVSARSFFQFQDVGGSKSSNKGRRSASSRYVYKLAYCPRDCRACIVPCYDVGIVSDGGKQWFGLGAPAVPLQFQMKTAKLVNN